MPFVTMSPVFVAALLQGHMYRPLLKAYFVTWYCNEGKAAASMYSIYMQTYIHVAFIKNLFNPTTHQTTHKLYPEA